jgi:glycopeptide antibiotics resistance protein
MPQRNPLHKLLQTFNTAKFWILGGILFIVMLTLFPFKFEAVAWGKKDALKEFFRNPSDSFDFFGNILLFMPLGYGLSQWLRPQRWNPIIKFALVIGISLLGTIAVETLQLFQPDRSSSVIDLFTNTLGGTLGGTIGLLGLEKFIQPTNHWLGQQWNKQRTLTIALSLWIVLMLGSTWKLSTMTRLNNWNPNYNLIVGNEATGGREWLGKVQGFSIIDRALSESEVQQLQQSPKFPTLETALADYDLTGSAPYRDRSPLNLPPLEPQSPNNPVPQDDKSLKSTKINENKSTSPEQPWYSTQKPPSKLTAAIQKSSSFTLATTFETRSLTQEGPARIISLSLDATERNLTLGQDNRQLIVRLRTPATGINGAFMELRSPNNLQLNRSHQVVLTYENAVLALYLDGNPPDHILLRPEMSFFRFVLPSQMISLPRGPKAMSLYPFVFYAIWFLPLGTLLGRLLVLLRKRQPQNPRKNQRNLFTLMNSLLLGLTIGGSSVAMATILKPFSSQPMMVGLTCLGMGILPIVLQLLHPIFMVRQTR